MADSLVTIVCVVAVLAGVVAIFTLVTSRGSWLQVGSGGIDARGHDGPDGGACAPPADEREQDIRQMLGARNARRERRGEQPLDLDEELAMLLRPSVDEGLRDEVRALVEARNRRRARNGLAPLDVDVAIERQLRELN
ncbi:MAG: hypothetical protein QOE31_3534 [Solirubrobacteraceae bacterium]|jgi:hypothetical protein|nr:hypothetical protein [Solirubrobacteraceae bacterium]